MKSKVSFVIVGDEVMKTDVISQPIGDELPDGTRYLGEVIINEEQVRRQAREYGVSEAQELARVVAHGVLHLLGYEDETPEKRAQMKAIEDAVVREVSQP